MEIRINISTKVRYAVKIILKSFGILILINRTTRVVLKVPNKCFKSLRLTINAVRLLNSQNDN